MNKVHHRIEQLYNRIKEGASAWKPEFIRLDMPEGERRLEEILDLPGISVHDEIFEQLAELLRCRNPKINWKNTSKKDIVDQYLAGKDILTYGVWVFYPWNLRLVHLLDKEEFIEARTNRNEYKITRDEKQLLFSKKVGVIGLSVGQSVSVTMALERSFGEIRLADFDVLEITNLNRIRTPLYNLGISKVVCVAREIMEIDPYLEVKCFEKGLNEENMDDFFLGGGKLDMVIDECDGLDIKVLARYKARELGIPVLMEASDRATVDVERFDLEPNRPLLHGLINDLDPEKLKTLTTNEEKVPYMLAIVGLDTISTRAKTSMIEIGETISTWPQLASAVTLGGGITADVCRRIFLGQYRSSGRYHIDLEDLIGDKKVDFSIPQYPKPAPAPMKNEWIGLVNAVSTEESILPEVIEDIIYAAHQAPSGGNLQPWHWMHKGNRLFLFFKKELFSSFLDPENIASYVSLGASLENAALAAAKNEYAADISYFPEAGMQELIAEVTLRKEPSAPNTAGIRLQDHILQRHTNRNIEASLPISAQELDFLKESVGNPMIGLKFFEEGSEKDTLEKCIASIERFRMLNKEGYRNFMEEMRWTKEEAEETRDGIDLACCDLTPTEEAGFRIARHEAALELIRELHLGKGLEKLSLKATSAAPVIGMLYMDRPGREDMVKGGRALERVWIAANASGMGFQPQSSVTLLIKRAETGQGLDAYEKEELDSLVNKLFTLVPAHKYPLFIFRLFKGSKPVVRSLRRDILHHFSTLS